VTGETVAAVNQCDITQPLPAYDTLLLDAMEAVSRKNFSTAILLSEASIENLARSCLEREFEKTPGVLEPGEIQSAKINKLLGELSQGLLGRSILQEDPQLYDNTLTLMKRRNERVQTGGLREKVDYSAIWAAMDAIQSAIRVIRWFGEPASYFSPLDCNGSLLCSKAYREL
jgi:hypothetical protein